MEWLINAERTNKNKMDATKDIQLYSVKKMVVRRGYKIAELEAELDDSIRIASKIIVNSGVEAVKQYRIELGGGEKAYRLTITKPYTNKKGFTSDAQFINNTYICKGGKSKYVLYWTLITADNFDTYWSVNPTTGLLDIHHPAR